MLWRGQAAGQLTGGDPFQPRVRLFGELAPDTAASAPRAGWKPSSPPRPAAGWAAAGLRAAIESGRIRGLARGLAYRLAEAGGLVDRRPLDGDVRALSQAERRALKRLGVRFGAFSLFICPPS